MSPEELRRAALDALGEHADERARDALAHAAVAVETARAYPAFDGVRVTLGVDARTLGRLRAAPALVDALVAALAAAVAATRGATLVDLSLRWLSAARPSAAAYRDMPPEAPEMALREALLEYLGGAGDHALTATLEHADVASSDPAEVTVRLPREEHEALRADAHAVARLTSAVRDLVGSAGARVRLRAR